VIDARAELKLLELIASPDFYAALMRSAADRSRERRDAASNRQPAARDPEGDVHSRLRQYGDAVPARIVCQAPQPATIDDYGAHSQRWIRKFEDGVAMRPQYKEVRQLKLFNP
jgi:hypothetical protein